MNAGIGTRAVLANGAVARNAAVKTRMPHEASRRCPGVAGIGEMFGSRPSSVMIPHGVALDGALLASILPRLPAAGNANHYRPRETRIRLPLARERDRLIGNSKAAPTKPGGCRPLSLNRPNRLFCPELGPTESNYRHLPLTCVKKSPGRRTARRRKAQSRSIC